MDENGRDRRSVHGAGTPECGPGEIRRGYCVSPLHPASLILVIRLLLGSASSFVPRLHNLSVPPNMARRERNFCEAQVQPMSGCLRHARSIRSSSCRPLPYSTSRRERHPSLGIAWPHAWHILQQFSPFFIRLRNWEKPVGVPGHSLLHFLGTQAPTPAYKSTPRPLVITRSKKAQKSFLFHLH